MATKTQVALRVALLVGGFALVTGCATVTKEELDAVKATAEAAQNAANAAQRTATQSQQAASGAQSTANQALAAAQAAQACCDATNQKLDRMFEQRQKKYENPGCRLLRLHPVFQKPPNALAAFFSPVCLVGD